MAGVTLVTPPATEPITKAQARAYLRNEDVTADDGLLDDLIAAARETAEKRQDRAYVTQTWDQFFDTFPGYEATPPPQRFPPSPTGAQPFELRKAPLQTVTTIKYTPNDGAPVTIAGSEYYVDAAEKVRGGALIYPKVGTYWPQDVLRAANGVEIRFVAGYGAAAAVPKRIQILLARLVAYYYYNRDAVGTLPDSLEQALLEDYVRLYA